MDSPPKEAISTKDLSFEEEAKKSYGKFSGEATRERLKNYRSIIRDKIQGLGDFKIKVVKIFYLLGVFLYLASSIALFKKFKGYGRNES